LAFLLEEGFQVTPVNPSLAGQLLQGQIVVARLSDIPQAVDMVDVFREGAALPVIVSETVAIGASVLWTQLGVRNLVAETDAVNRGLDLVIDKCPAQELPRLRSCALIL
jgi:predicted CoA-binding protein